MSYIDKCPRCGGELKCLGGHSAHPANWYCADSKKSGCNWPDKAQTIADLQKQVAALEAAPIGIKVDGAGQIWITFDPGDGRSGMLNLNNIVLEKSAKGITKSIYLDAIREALKQEDKT